MGSTVPAHSITADELSDKIIGRGSCSDSQHARRDDVELVDYQSADEAYMDHCVMFMYLHG